MKKILIIISFLAVFLLLMLPSIPALEYNETVKAIRIDLRNNIRFELEKLNTNIRKINIESILVEYKDLINENEIKPQCIFIGLFIFKLICKIIGRTIGLIFGLIFGTIGRIIGFIGKIIGFFGSIIGLFFGFIGSMIGLFFGTIGSIIGIIFGVFGRILNFLLP